MILARVQSSSTVIYVSLYAFFDTNKTTFIYTRLNNFFCLFFIFCHTKRYKCFIIIIMKLLDIPRQSSVYSFASHTWENCFDTVFNKFYFKKLKKLILMNKLQIIHYSNNTEGEKDQIYFIGTNYYQNFLA